MNRLKVAIIGTGKVAHIHAAGLVGNERCEFVAALGRNPKKVEPFVEKYGVAGYTDLDEFLANSGAQAVCICTPHPAHRNVAVACAKAGMHLLIEKPLASSLQDCDDILDAAKEAGVRVGMVCQRRFFEPCARIKSAIDAGKVACPILGMVTVLGWRDQAYYDSDPWRGKWDLEGGGVLVNQAVHQLDLLLWYMGEVEEVSGYWANLNHPTIEVEDTAVAIVRFKSGALGQILASNSFNPAIHGKVSVLGSNGAHIGVQTDGGQMFIAGMSSIAEPPLNDYWSVPGEEGELARHRVADEALFKTINATERYHELLIEEFVDAVLAGRDPCVSGEDGRRAVELFTAIYRSQRDKVSIRFPLQPESDRDDLDGRVIR